MPRFGSLYALTAIVALLVACDLLFWWLGYERLRNPWGCNLSLLAALLGGARIVYGAVAALLERDVGADLALAIAMVAALVLREYWVAAEVVLIAMVGESLEALTFSRTQRDLRRMFELRPRQARVRRGEQTVDVPIGQVRAGDLVVVRPGERIPVDGNVASGRTAVDQSTLTGESLPIDKSLGDAVFAGTMNQFGAIEVLVEKVGDETTLGQVIRLVAKARANKAHVERIADRMARFFLPFVLTMAAITLVATNYAAIRALWAGQPASSQGWSWMPFLAVLVVACPCALILATPAAVMAALAWMARRGVLATGGAAIERLASVNRFAFDKTGTLTRGALELGDCEPLGTRTVAELLAWTAAAEQHSEHLIARALVRAAVESGQPLPTVDDFEALPGAGVVATVRLTDGPARRVLVGNTRLMHESAVPVPPEAEESLGRLAARGQTTLLVAVDGEIMGVVGVRDTLRSEAAEVLEQLRRLGIEDIVLLTGDRLAAAQHVASTLGIEQCIAELRPQEKANWLADWTRVPGRSGQPIVAMVGDGVNDALALASADVGLALGGVGSDIAAEAGDLILMGEPLSPLPGLVRLARETVRVIRQNILLFAFGLNVTGIVLTGWIIPTWSAAWAARAPVAAALFHQLGSLLVLLNAMRLLWFERWQSGLLARCETWLADRCHHVLELLSPLSSVIRPLWDHRRAAWCALACLGLVTYLAQMIVIVQPDELALVQRCGRLQAILPPGLHVCLPPPWDSVRRERPARVRSLPIGLQRSPIVSQSATMPMTASAPIEWSSPHTSTVVTRPEDIAQILTGDQSLVELVGSVQFRVVDLRAYRFEVRDADRVLAALAEGITREVVARQPLLRDDEAEVERPELLSNGRGLVEQEIRRRLQARADEMRLGVEVLPEGVCLQDLHPPRDVVSAFRDVSSAFKEKERLRNEGETYYRGKLINAAGQNAWRTLSVLTGPLDDAGWSELWSQLQPQLAGEAAAQIHAAQAFAADKSLKSEGEADRFQQKAAARSSDPRLTEFRLFLEALQAALPGKPKLILDRKHAGRRHLLLGWPPETATSAPPIVEPSGTGPES